MTRTKALCMLAVAGILGTALTACIGNSNASGNGVSQADFDALKAQVTALQTTVSAQQTTNADQETAISEIRKHVNVAKLQNGSKSKSAGMATMAGGDLDDCNMLGALPSDKPAFQATAMQCRSKTGYLFALGVPDGGKPLPTNNGTGAIYFATADCTGTAYVSQGDVSKFGRLSGAVFTYDDAVERFHIGYVPANAPDIGLAANSYMVNTNCYVYRNDFAFGMMEILANDSAITGVSNEPYAGPILLDLVQ